MAYRRRYYEPFVGTTQTIADEAITGDKINPGAVTEEKIATSAVTTAKIKDGDVKADDLGLQSVETSKIKDLAVTAAKIAAGAVTDDKIAGDVLTRPLSTPISTAEIAALAVTAALLAAQSVETAKIKDGNVTAIKLAADSVEEAKIKDEAVTAAKIKTSTITKTQLGPNCVEGVELKDGVVSAAKLSTDAVETDKILDDAVTTPKILDDNITTPKILDEAVTGPKLAKKSLLDFRFTNQVFFDDFIGSTLHHAWANSGDAGGSAVMNTTLHSALITSGAVNGDKYRINFNGVKSFIHTDTPFDEWAVALGQLVTCKVEFGQWGDATHYNIFRFEPAVDARWHAISRNGGAEEDTDTGIDAVVLGTKFSIDWIAAADCKFYINDALEASHTTQVPEVGYEPWAEIEAVGAGARNMSVGVFHHTSLRPTP